MKWIVGGLLMLSQGGAPAMTAAERAGMQIGPSGIRNPALGFSLPHPGPSFSADAARQASLDAAFAGHPEIGVWVLVDHARSESVIIQVSKAPHMTESDFRLYAQGHRDGMTKRGTSTVVSDTVEWHKDRGDYRLSLKHQSGSYITTRCLSRPGPSGAEVVCVQTTAHEANGLDAVRAGLRVAP